MTEEKETPTRGGWWSRMFRGGAAAHEDSPSLEQLANANDELQAELDVANGQLAMSRDDLVQAQHALASTEASLEALRGHQTEIQQRFDQCVERLDVVRARAEKAEAHVARLKAQLQQVQADTSAGSSQVRKLETQNEAASKKLAEYAKRIAELERAEKSRAKVLAKKDASVQELTVELKQVRAEAQAATRRVESDAAALAAAQTGQQRAERETARLLGELQSLRDKVDSLSAKSGDTELLRAFTWDALRSSMGALTECLDGRRVLPLTLAWGKRGPELALLGAESDAAQCGDQLVQHLSRVGLCRASLDKQTKDGLVLRLHFEQSKDEDTSAVAEWLAEYARAWLQASLGRVVSQEPVRPSKKPGEFTITISLTGRTNAATGPKASPTPQPQPPARQK